MLDPHLLRAELAYVAEQLARRGIALDTGRIEALEARRKAIQVRTQELQGERNSRSRLIGQAKKAGEEVAPLLAQVADLGDKLKAAEAELAGIQEAQRQIALGLPNLPHASVPDAATRRITGRSGAGASPGSSTSNPRTMWIWASPPAGWTSMSPPRSRAPALWS